MLASTISNVATRKEILAALFPCMPAEEATKVNPLKESINIQSKPSAVAHSRAGEGKGKKVTAPVKPETSDGNSTRSLENQKSVVDVGDGPTLGEEMKMYSGKNSKQASTLPSQNVAPGSRGTTKSDPSKFWWEVGYF